MGNEDQDDKEKALREKDLRLQSMMKRRITRTTSREVVTATGPHWPQSTVEEVTILVIKEASMRGLFGVEEPIKEVKLSMKNTKR